MVKCRRILSAVLLLCLLFCLAGCGKTDGQSPAGQSAAAAPQAAEAAEPGGTAETEQVLYSRQEYLLPGGCSVRGAARLGEKLLLYGYKDGAPVLGLTGYEMEEGVPRFTETALLPLDAQSPYYATVQGVTAGDDGFFYALTGEYPPLYTRQGEYFTNNDYQGRIAVLKLSADGETVDRMEIPQWPWEFCLGIAVDESGRVYLLGEDCVASFPWQSEEVSTVQPEGGALCSMAMTSAGPVLCAQEGDGYRYYVLESPERLKPMPLENPCSFPTVEVGNLAATQGLDGEYIVSANSHFLACDPEEAAVRDLYQWDYTAYPGGCDYACRLAESCFACTVGEDYLLVTGLKEEPVRERSAVRVALYDMGESNAAGILTELNRRGGAYAYEMTEYPAEQRQRLLADILAGDKVDLVLFNNNLDVSSDAFEDLLPYIDGDPDLSREDFLSGLLDKLCDGGQLHELWDGVSVRTLAARTADVEGREGLRPADYQAILEANGQYEAVFQSFMDKENLLKWVSEAAMAAYIDVRTASCHFDSPAFADLLAWCAAMGDGVKEGSGEPGYELSQVVLSPEMISNPARLAAIREGFGQPFTFVGFPDGGSGLSCFSCSYNGGMAIPANSANKEGAWAYLRGRLSEEAQLSMDYALSVNRNALNRKAEATLPPELAEQLTALIGSVSSAARFADSQVRDILLDCGRMYLAGDKTLEDTVQLIQSRVSLYLAEQYG